MPAADEVRGVGGLAGRAGPEGFPGEGGKAAPYGLCDITTNTGWVSVGTDHDTAALAVESVRRWWKDAGREEYPQAGRLLVTADAGGSNGYRTQAWKAELAALAAETGLEITVCHFPSGTSKWNKVEHRLFSHITMNWDDRLLTSHEVVAQTLAATTARTRLAVRAELDDSEYAARVQVTDAQLKALPLARHDWHGDWNYTLLPRGHDLPPYLPPGTARSSTASGSNPTRDDDGRRVKCQVSALFCSPLRGIFAAVRR